MDIAAEFEGRLKDMVNYIMNKTISLQVRAIFVIYLPNKQQNWKQYYVFNIYLYNPTGNIKFSQAIAETKDFATRMKYQMLLTLLNGMKIGLKTRFAHNIQPHLKSFVDLSNGQLLVAMKKTVWETRIQRPTFEISDVHRCYRTGHFLRDINVMGTLVMEITPSVTIYGTEIEGGGIKGKIYICINLFVIPAAREDMSPTPTIKLNLDILDDEDKGLLDKGDALVVIFVVFTIFGIIFCKVRAHVVAGGKYGYGRTPVYD